jgi:hypothetical protein
MNEEQEKPAKKWYKKRINIFIFVLLLLVCVTITLIVLLRGQPDGNCENDAWCTIRNQIQHAVSAYAENHSGALPTLSGSYTNDNCSSCHVINISALLVTNGGPLRTVPSGCNLSAIGNDNCGGNASLGCVNGSHYIWIVDQKGIVYSYCAGYGCPSNNSGRQGVWP